jgi:hypothetical protein
MLSTSLKRSLPTIVIVVGLLATSAPAGATGAIVTDNKDPDKLRGASLTAPLGSTKGSVVHRAFFQPEPGDEVLLENDLDQPDMHAKRPTSPPAQGS